MRRFARPAAGAVLIAGLLGTAVCGESSESRIAARILDHHRRATGAKPLPVSQTVLLRLSSPDGSASGKGEVAWEGPTYRETVSSAGATVARGIQGGKAYFTDEDGVTRVASDPVLRELETRAYFWKRAYLFGDWGRARIGLGASDDASVSVRLRPPRGNSLLLVFSRGDGRLLSVRSPRFHLDFETATRFRDLSDPRGPAQGEVAWIGLPVGALPDVRTGGGKSRFEPAPAEVPVDPDRPAFLFPAEVSGRPIRLRLDAAVDGPLRISPEIAARLGLPFRKDIFGRYLAGGAALSIGTLAYPSIFVERAPGLPEEGSDAVAGGVLFRETVVEFDLEARRLRFHDPATWVAPERFTRVVIDDDGNRPMAILRRKGEELRLLCGSVTGSPALSIAEETARRLGLPPDATTVDGLRWGPVALPRLPLRLDAGAVNPDWGEDGQLGFELLRRFHFFLDMSHRWIYLRAP
jgi:hypothetical protein